MTRPRLSVGILGTIALCAAACATGIAPADSLGEEQQQAPAPSSTSPAGSTDRGDAGLPQSSAPDAGHAHPEAGTVADAAPDTGPTTCTKTLTIPSVHLSDSRCSDINTKVTKAPATMTYACAGGAASATFGTQAFTGTVTGTKVSITNVEKFTLQSCQLESTQTVTGDLAALPLAYAYSEKFVGGDCSGFIHCVATGNVTVQ